MIVYKWSYYMEKLETFKDFEFDVVECDLIAKDIWLKSLEWMPIVKWSFDCSHNELTTLKWMKKVWWDFDCTYNELTSLERINEVWWDIYNEENLL